MVKRFDSVIVGAGLSGAIVAERLANNLGQKVLVVDKREHIGGNCFDYFDENGICIHKYGPHIFHTEMQHVWDYLNNFTKFNDYEFKPKVMIDGKAVTLPFNLNTLHQVFDEAKASVLEQKLIERYSYNGKVSILNLKNEEDEDLKDLSEFIYKNVFEGYTVKQWGVKPEDIDPAVTARVPVRISRDDRYFQDKYQGIPVCGYTKMIENILTHPNIEVRLNTEFAELGDEIEFDKLFYTGSIDEFFGYKHGELPYRSLSFDIVEKEMEYYQEAAMVNYPSENNFTRVTEHKYFLGTKCPKTVVSFEYPQQFELGVNERYYPIENSANQSIYERYLNDVKKQKNIYFLGRLGDYKYYNMDLTVDRALKLFEEIFNK